MSQEVEQKGFNPAGFPSLAEAADLFHRLSTPPGPFPFPPAHAGRAAAKSPPTAGSSHHEQPRKLSAAKNRSPSRKTRLYRSFGGKSAAAKSGDLPLCAHFIT